jgi:hypothetical protein
MEVAEIEIKNTSTRQHMHTCTRPGRQKFKAGRGRGARRGRQRRAVPTTIRLCTSTANTGIACNERRERHAAERRETNRARTITPTRSTSLPSARAVSCGMCSTCTSICTGASSLLLVVEGGVEEEAAAAEEEDAWVADVAAGPAETCGRAVVVGGGGGSTLSDTACPRQGSVRRCRKLSKMSGWWNVLQATPTSTDWEPPRSTATLNAAARTSLAADHPGFGVPWVIGGGAVSGAGGGADADADGGADAGGKCRAWGAAEAAGEEEGALRSWCISSHGPTSAIVEENDTCTMSG